MGCWEAALGRLKIEPEPTADLIKEYLFFSAYSCPESYRKYEVFSNPWFFDKDLKLASFAGKFCEPSVWYEFLKENFFEKRGYKLIGDPQFVWEGEFNLHDFSNERVEEWYNIKPIMEQRFLKPLAKDSNDEQ